MKKIIFLGVCVFVGLVSSAFAVQYVPYSLTRTYYSDSSKTQIVGSGILSCKYYQNNFMEWLYDGQVTSYYREQVGEKCATGGAMGPDIEYYFK